MMNPIGIDNAPDWKRIRHLFKIGIFAALLVLIGDMLLGWGAADEALTGIEGYFSRYLTVSDVRIFFLSKSGAEESHKGLPPHPEEACDRLNKGADLIQKAVLNFSRRAEGERPEKQRNKGNSAQRSFENIPRFEEGFLQDMSPVRPVIRRQLHDHTAAGFPWARAFCRTPWKRSTS